MVTKLPHHCDCTKKAGQLTPGCCCVWARETQAVPSAVKQPTGSSAVVVGFCYVLPSKWRKDPNNGNEAQVHMPQLSVGTFTAPGPSEEQHDGAQADHEVSTVPWEVF